MLTAYNSYISLKNKVEDLRKKQTIKLQMKIAKLKREEAEIIAFLECTSSSEGEEEEEKISDVIDRLIYFDETRDRQFPLWASNSTYTKDEIYPFFFRLDKKIDASRSFCLKKNGRYYVNIFLRIPLNKNYNDAIEILSSKEDIPLLPVPNEVGNYESKEFLLMIITKKNSNLSELNIVKHCKIVIKEKKIWLSTSITRVDVTMDSFRLNGPYIIVSQSRPIVQTRVIRNKNRPFMDIKEGVVTWGKSGVPYLKMKDRIVFMRELFPIAEQ